MGVFAVAVAWMMVLVGLSDGFAGGVGIVGVGFVVPRGQRVGVDAHRLRCESGGGSCMCVCVGDGLITSLTQKQLTRVSVCFSMPFWPLVTISTPVVTSAVLFLCSGL